LYGQSRPPRQWRKPSIDSPLDFSGWFGTAAEENETTLQQLQGAASRAAQTMGPARGPVYGTLVHSAFKTEVDALGGSLRTEVSVLNGNIVRYGTPGSVRLDAVEIGSNGQIQAVYDLKTGSAALTPSRTQQIQQAGKAPVPVYEVRP
jgi:hypothetical protein